MLSKLKGHSRYAGTVVLRIAYGHVVECDEDKYVLLAEELAHITAAAIQPGKWLVDSFPWRTFFFVLNSAALGLDLTQVS
jgi:hypothetical protein